MTMTRHLLTAMAFGATGFAPLSASAQIALTCHFDTECFEADGCDETAFDLDIAQPDASVSVTRVASVSGTELANTRRAPSGTVSLYASNDSATMVTVIAPDLTARHAYIVHQGPQLITYHGTCEGRL